MAAYAALVSLEHIIDKLELHPHPPISIHKNQVHLLTQKITFLQEFLESYNPQLPYTTEADPLETRIADAAYAAEDVIESHIVDRIKNDGAKNIIDSLYQSLEKVIQNMSLIQNEAIENKQIMKVKHQLQHRKSTPSSSSYSSINAQKSRSMVGVDDIKLQMMDNLTADHLDLRIIPIVGMGGTGKTTLARNISQERRVMEHFHICAWTTISQEYSIRGIFLELLSQLIEEEVNQDLSEGALGEKLYKQLFGRKYLIIMDDIWSIDAWDKVRIFFPNTKNGSRIIVTTRLSNLASVLPGSTSLKTELLDESDSWELLSKTVFGEKDCPMKLEEIGKKIGKSCKGLPLSIVVVGGLLAKSEHTREYWEYIEENLNSIVNLDDDERCLKLLHVSYKQLPIYLKPCFLYTGAFPEDVVINVAWLVKLWVAEGFLKPVSKKSMEEVANEYLKDLCDRNLVIIHKLGSLGNIKECKIHDLLRDLCLREARKERFYTPPRFLVIPTKSKEEEIDALHSTPQARSLFHGFRKTQASPHNFRLLRTYRATHDCPSLENCLDLVNLRLVGPISLIEEKLGSSIYRLWNLETLNIKGVGILPYEIWYMPQIRHVQCGGIRLLDPPTGNADDDFVVLANLHTLETIIDFKCSSEVAKRIPNIKKLRVVYTRLSATSTCLDNLVRLQKLEFLDCSFPSSTSASLHNLDFPRSLKKINLRMDSSPFLQEVLEKIGDLPLLVKLKLEKGCFEEDKWETVEGQFSRLKYLEIVGSDLERLIWESSHFPCLERLVLRKLRRLEEIPLDVAEILTLGLIFVECYNAAPVICLKRIADEQEELYGEVAVKILVNLKRGRIFRKKESWSSPHIDTAQGRVWMQRKYR